MLAFLLFSCIALAGVLLYLHGSEWASRRRSARLCLRCHAVRLPACQLTGRLSCPICEASSPVPLRSLEARLYFAGSMHRHSL